MVPKTTTPAKKSAPDKEKEVQTAGPPSKKREYNEQPSPNKSTNEENKDLNLSASTDKRAEEPVVDSPKASTPPNKEGEEKESSDTASSLSKTFELLASYLRPSWPSKEGDTNNNSKSKMIIRPMICQRPLKDVTDFCLSFSGCGFLGTYHFGAAACLLKFGGTSLIDRTTRVSGASAGSLVASLIVLAPNRLQEGLNVMYEMADELNSLKFGALTQGFFLNERLVKIVDDYLPQDISRAQGKLTISLTDYKTRQNHLISTFPSREYLIQCLLASCFIPMYSMGYNALPPEIDGKRYIDGGYTNNLPDFDDVRTLTVSPFSGGAEISPVDAPMIADWFMSLGSQQMSVNLQNIVRGAQALFPPSREVLKEYYRNGYKDTFQFLYKNDLLIRPKGARI